MTILKISQLKKNGIMLSGDERLLKYLPQWKINQALNAAYQNAGFREKEVMDHITSIEIKSHIYPGDHYKTATIFGDSDNSIDIIIEHETYRKNGYKPGDITG